LATFSHLTAFAADLISRTFSGVARTYEDEGNELFWGLF
jgi:hypothetical protein